MDAEFSARGTEGRRKCARRAVERRWEVLRAGESGGCFAHEIGLGEQLRDRVRRLRPDRQPAEHAHAQGVSSGPRGGDRALSPGRGFGSKEALGGGEEAHQYFARS